MAHKKKDIPDAGSYTVGDAIKIADDIFNLNKEKKYNPGAFIHGLIFALEYAQYSYRIPHQQLALIKRDCRNYFKNIENIRPQKS
jgi:hypothetical protein